MGREHSACGKFSNFTFETFFSWFQRNFQDGECSDASKDVLPVLQGNQAVPSDQLQEFERRSDVKKTQVWPEEHEKTFVQDRVHSL